MRTSSRTAWNFAVIAMTALLAVGSSAAAQGTTASAMVNPDQATAQQMAALPNMNAMLAAAVVAKRPFKTMLDVDAVLKPTLSAEQRAQLYARLFRPINLNTASREEIMLIPGMGPRMAHEFEEYRPYRNIEQFRREIGKYVDQKEVGRFERYVSLP